MKHTAFWNSGTSQARGNHNEENKVFDHELQDFTVPGRRRHDLPLTSR